MSEGLTVVVPQDTKYELIVRLSTFSNELQEFLLERRWKIREDIRKESRAAECKQGCVGAKQIKGRVNGRAWYFGQRLLQFVKLERKGLEFGGRHG